MKKRLIFCLIVCSLVSSMLFAGGKKEKTDVITVGFSNFDMQFEYFQQLEKGIKDAVAERGWEYILHDQKSDASLMVSGCQDLINQNIDILIICPYKPEALGPIVNEAKKRGIPVIISDIGGGGTPYDAIVVSNNIEGGSMAAEFALAAYKGNEKEVAIIKLDPSQVYSSMRGDGFRQIMEAEGYKIVKELFCNGRSEEAYKIMQDILVANPNVKIVFGEDDPTAAAASQAARDSGISDILFIGFDGSEIGLSGIENNTLAATVMQLPYKIGTISVDTGEKLLNRENVVFDNVSEREILVDVEVITKENVEKARTELN